MTKAFCSTINTKFGGLSMSVFKVLYASKNAEVDFLAKNIIGTYDTSSLHEDDYMEKIFVDFKFRSQLFSVALNEDKTESNLKVLSENINVDIRAIFGLAAGLLHSRSGDTSTLAAVIDTICTSYGLGIVTESYALKSSHVDSILRRFAEPSAASAIKALQGMGELVQSLKKNQGIFDKAYLEYEASKASDRAKDKRKELKTSLLDCLNSDIVLHINAMAKAHPTQYGEFARTVAQIIDDSNAAVKKRLGGSTEETPDEIAESSSDAE